jgi:hypothetical protein
MEAFFEIILAALDALCWMDFDFGKKKERK